MVQALFITNCAKSPHKQQQQQRIALKLSVVVVSVCLVSVCLYQNLGHGIYMYSVCLLLDVSPLLTFAAYLRFMYSDCDHYKH